MTEPQRTAAWRSGMVALSALAVVAHGACAAQPEQRDEAAVAAPERPEPVGPARLRVEVLETYPHDPAAYTQGLLWHEGSLYESSGQYGESTLRRVELETGSPVATVDLPPDLFGEGLARVEDRLIQLTWRAGRALVWDTDSLSKVGEHRYDGEGWGLCFDGTALVMSDGTSRLQIRDPDSLELRREVLVVMGDGAVGRLNELECVGDRVYANVYTTDWIVRIDPGTGNVEALIDASGLLPADSRAGADVLNGIAFDPDLDRFYLTGKLWPWLYAVRFVPATP